MIGSATPTSLLMDRDGPSSTVAIFATDGTFIESLDRASYARPGGGSVGPDGRTWVAAMGSSKFLALSPNGELIVEWAVDNDGYAANIKVLEDARIVAVSWATDTPTSGHVRIYRLR